MNKALELAQIILMYEDLEECVITHKFICPHKIISGKHCIYCKIPDLFPLGR